MRTNHCAYFITLINVDFRHRKSTEKLTVYFDIMMTKRSDSDFTV